MAVQTPPPNCVCCKPSKNGHGKSSRSNGVRYKPNQTANLTISLTLGQLVILFTLSCLLAFWAGRSCRPLVYKAPIETHACPLGIYEKGKGGKVTGPISNYTFQNYVKKKKKEPVLEDSGSLSGSGQHLVVDMEGLDAAFLNSDERLSLAIVETAKRTSLALLSYHCHALLPMGVSCVGIFSRGHVAFHTWPEEGVITLDFYSWSQTDAFRGFLSTITDLFGVVDDQAPTVVWSHKRRGFHTRDDRANDVAFLVETPRVEFKEEIASVQTRFQRIHIYDLVGYSRHVSTVKANRVVFLDGRLQSTRQGDAAYHEALVHPAMFAHDNPERVAIIGGGEGATLREVLKHETVKEAIMVEIDEEMIRVSRKYLPEWSSCDNLVGSTESCFDEPRAQVYTEDALAWFIDRFYSEKDKEPNAKGLENAEPMDIIIVDALDPEDNVEFCDALYDNGMFMNALYNGLSDEGVLVMQLGEAPKRADPADSISRHFHRAALTEELEEIGFESIHVYEESHCDFGAPWTYLVAFKDYESRANWYANEAEIELEIQNRAMRTKSGKSPFLHFDGTTMVSYQAPHKNFESVFCKEEPAQESCDSIRGFDPYKPNVPTSLLEVKRSQACENAGRGVFVKVEIPEGAYIGLEHSGYSLDFHPATHELIMGFRGLKEGEAMAVFRVYVPGNSSETKVKGTASSSVDSSILAFINHGCNGTYNAEWKQDVSFRLTEFSVQKELDIIELLECSIYNPVADRHHRNVYSGCDMALRKINAGEELLQLD